MRNSALRPVIFATLASAFVSLCGGCMDPVENRATDSEFLRAPGENCLC